MSDVRVFDTPLELEAATAAWLAEKIEAAVRERGACSVALSGGNSPRSFLARLAQHGLPWDRVDWFFVDERCVPPDSPDSNFKMANEALFLPARVPAARIHRMEGERPDADAAARDYEARLPAALDVVVLGIGEDGHTASLFPGSPLVLESKRRVVKVEDSPKPPPRRLTLTAPVITGARAVLMVVTGKGKAAAVARALESDAPVAQVPAGLARGGTWMLDREAAAALAARTKEATVAETNGKLAQVGLIGLGVMGQNLVLNMEDHGFSVAVWNRDTRTTDSFMAKNPGKKLMPFKTLQEFVASLEQPRRILIMVTAGGPVDAVINSLKPLIAKDDVLLDCGNSWFKDTQRREAELVKDGFHFVGMGVSGGEEGARHGPSLMPGGRREAYDRMRPVFDAIAAKTDSGPCSTYVGPDGAGHFVKMVHNGIEYADMQLIAETYDLLKRGLGMSPDAIAQLFNQWNKGPLDSFLIEITARVLGVKDAETGKPLVDLVLDKAGQKGTGKWTVQVATELAVPVPSIAAALDARILSSMKDERVAAGQQLKGPSGAIPEAQREGFVQAIHDALYAAKVTTYAQGMRLISVASHENKWNIDLREMARIWKGGCIIRAKLLDTIMRAYERRADLPSLLLDTEFAKTVDAAQGAWRKVVGQAALAGIPIPAMSASLAYFDSYRTAELPQNLTQAQRDAFGAHTYERKDHPERGFVHTEWLGPA